MAEGPIEDGARFGAVGCCAMVSFRLGMSDGVSVVAAAWQQAFQDLGWSTTTVAAEGPVDRAVPGLAMSAGAGPTESELDAALADADLVVAENLLSIPLNLAASRMLADRLRGRPAILHHHDPPWQRQRYAHVTELPPDDPMWAHVTINKLTEAQFADRGLRAITIYNGFDLSPPAGDRSRTRAALEVAEDEWLVAHPVRAIARKNIPAAVELCRRLPATYWLPGDVEEGFGETLDRLLTNARCRVIRRPVDAVDITMPDLYAASDLVVFPSWWEGFGNPPIEAAIHRRPAAVGRYPVADELRSLGFRWLDPTDAPVVAKALIDQPTADLEFNRRVVEEHLSLPTMTESIARLLEARGWQP